MARSYVLGPHAARELKRLIRGNGGTSRRDAVAGALAFDSDYAHPYTVQWAQSLNDGDGAWIIWLPPGHLFVDGKEVDVTAAPSGTGGMTAAGGDYPAGWYVLDLGDDYTAGDDFTLYLDVGATPPVFGIDSTSMTTPVKICKVTDATKAVVGIVESALVFAAGGLLHPFEIQWAPSQNSGDGAWVIWLPPGCRRVSGVDKVPSQTAATGLPSGWYLLGLTIPSSGVTTVYLTVYPIQHAGASGLNYFEFSASSSTSGADWPIARIDGATKKVVQLQTTSIVTGTTMDELGVRHSLDFTNDTLTSVVSIEQDGTIIDTATATVSIPTGGGGGGGGGSITLTPGSGILINDSNQAQTGTSFTIKAVYV